MVAQDYVLSMLGQPNQREELPTREINMQPNNAAQGIDSFASDTSITETSGESQRSSAYEFTEALSGEEERTPSNEGHVRESYHSLRMSDFLFEGVKTRNIIIKDTDSDRLTHQKLESQFRNMFK